MNVNAIDIYDHYKKSIAPFDSLEKVLDHDKKVIYLDTEGDNGL